MHLKQKARWYNMKHNTVIKKGNFSKQITTWSADVKKLPTLHTYIHAYIYFIYFFFVVNESEKDKIAAKLLSPYSRRKFSFPK